MKLTTKGRYAVAAMADMAAFCSGSPTTLSAISERQGISLSYLEQLFGKLRRAKLVESVRGANGGYVLAKSPDDLRISEIVSAVDEQIRTTACVPGAALGCTGSSARCLTHDLWDELGAQIESFLHAVTLEDVLAKRIRKRAVINPPASVEAAE